MKKFISKIMVNINRLKKISKAIFTTSKKKINPQYKKFMLFAKRKPITAFLILLALLLSLIVLSNIVNRPVPETQETKLSTKEVSVYTIGSSPKIKVQAQIEFLV